MLAIRPEERIVHPIASTLSLSKQAPYPVGRYVKTAKRCTGGSKGNKLPGRYAVFQCAVTRFARNS